MSAGVGNLRRMSFIVGSLRTVLSRSSLYHCQTRNFFRQAACAAETKVEMPSLSPTMEVGTIVKWHIKEGEKVNPGDILCDIQTDKAVVGMEYDDEGILAKIVKPENSADIKVGTLIAVMVDEGDDWQNVSVPAEAGDAPAPSAATPAPAAATPAPAAATPAPAAAPTGGSTPGIKVEMPSLSPTMEIGTILKWHKKEGEKVTAGDILCDIQTDKAVVGMEYDDEGILAKILMPDNTKDVKVGSLIAMMVAEGDDWQDVQIPAVTAAPSAPAAAASPPPAAAAAAPKAPPQVVEVVEEVDLPGVGPSVKKLLHEYNIAASAIPASGPKGNLLKGDILNYIKSKGLTMVDQTAVAQPSASAPPAAKAVPGAAPAPSVPEGAAYIDIPLTTMRKVIAKRLTESKTTVPHAYATIDCSMQTAMNTRKLLVGQGVKVSVNDFIIKAAGFALERSPRVNGTYQNDTYQPWPTVDISVAVATEGGLITPIVPNVPSLGVAQISETVKSLAEKARTGKLQPHEFQGGSFCISNLGMFGIKEFSAVINPPQVGILAIGSTRPTVGTENSIIDPKMAVTLSYDSRVIDEQEATRFLEFFRLALQNPDILVGGGLSVRNEEFAFGSSM